MEEGVQLYQEFTEALDSNDLGRIASFMRSMQDERMLARLSFYSASAMLRDLDDYARKLRFFDSRGIGGRSKGVKKRDVLALCKSLRRMLVEKKNSLKKEALESREDYTQKYREFLPRGLTRDLDHGPETAGARGKKVKSG